MLHFGDNGTVAASFARSKRVRFFTCGARQRIDGRSERNH